MAKLTFTKAASQVRIARIEALLSQSPMNVHQLAQALPLSKRWVLEYLAHLHDLKRVHVLRWDKDIEERAKRHAIEVWAFGPGVDAPRPAADGLKVRRRRAWESLKADEDRHERVTAMRRVRRRIAKARPDIAAAWITPINGSQYREAA